MKKLFIANTNFEFELADERFPQLLQAIEMHPVTLQLQFLPLLFADPEDEILVTSMPDLGYLQSIEKIRGKLPKLVLDAEDGLIQSWGWSRSVRAWAEERGLAYDMPDWEIVKLVNSKEWSFLNSPKLKGAELIFSLDQLKKWVRQNNTPAVAKSCFGLSGRGHCLFEDLHPKILAFCEKEWRIKRPVIVEPWVERVLDFSTQWFIDAEKVTFLGATKMFNTSTGSYMGTMTGGVPKALLQEHVGWAVKILTLAKELGYRGYAGVDAMVHKEGLQPIVEVNARMTMALAALFMKQKFFPHSELLFQYMNVKEGLLPNYLQIANKIIRFNKQLQVSAANADSTLK